MAVKAADNTADSRFADVARVSQHAELLKRLTQMRNVIDLEQKRLDAVDKDILELKAQWQLFIEKYCLPALDVVELSEWLSKRNLFLQRYQSYLEVKEQMVSAEDQGISVRESLSTELYGAGIPACGEKETLAQVIARIRGVVDQANKAAASQKVLARKKKSADEKLTDAEKLLEDYQLRFESWKTSWNESMATIRLSSGAEAEEAAARLEQFDALEDALDTLDGAKAELETAQATANQIEQEALRLCEALSYERANRPAEAVIETFYERLAEAKELEQRRKTLEDMIREAGKARTQADQALESAEQALSKLKSAAQCETLEELVEAENRSAEYQKLENEIAAIESRLVTASALPLQELLVQAEGQDIVLVQAALERVIEDLEACTSQVETLHGKLIEKQAALSKVDGEAIAAAAEQRAADATARLSNHVANYTSARLASAILAEVVESYQQRYQGPLLARASELFAGITGGRFIKVATDFDEDMTILVGVRPNGIALVFMRGGVLPSPISPTLEENEVISVIGGTSAGVRKSFTALHESFLIKTMENGNYVYRFKHPTIRDAFASFVADDLELMDIYLTGWSLDKLFNEVSCGYVGIEGVKVIIPINRYDALIARIKAFDTSNRNNNYLLNIFLSRRCDCKFLESFIANNQEFIQNIEVSSPLNYSSEIDIIVRLFSYMLLPESERLRFAAAISDLAIKTPDSGFLNSEINALMTSDELDNITDRIKTELVPNLDEKIVQWQNKYNRESNYFQKDDPKYYFDKLNNSLEDYKNKFVENETITNKIDNALKKIDSIVEALKSELPVDKKDEEELFNRNMQEDARKSPRSIFDDVDL